MESRKLEKIIEIKEKLELLSPYIKNDNMKNIVKWAKEDLEEIYAIQRELETKKLLVQACRQREVNEIKIIKSDSIEKDILNVYRNIEKELNYWRIVNLEIKVNEGV